MHRDAACRTLLQKLRVGRPAPRTDRYDPFALRALLLLGVFVLTVIVGDSAADRLRSAFRFGGSHWRRMRFDAWVTPPAYTGTAPDHAGGRRAAHGPRQRSDERPPDRFEVPDRSVLVVRASGARRRPLSSKSPGDDGADRAAGGAGRRPTPATSSELKVEVRRSGTVIAS